MYSQVVQSGYKTPAVIAMKKAYVLANNGKVYANPADIFTTATQTFEDSPELVCDFWARLGIDEFEAKNYEISQEYFANAQALIDEGVYFNQEILTLYNAKYLIEAKQDFYSAENILGKLKKQIGDSPVVNIQDAYYSTYIQCKALENKWQDIPDLFTNVKNPDVQTNYNYASALYNQQLYSECNSFLRDLLAFEFKNKLNSKNLSLYELYALTNTKQGVYSAAVSIYNQMEKQGLLNEENRAVLHALPSLTVGDEKRALEKETLQKITSAWTAEQALANDEAIASLERWQKTPDSSEALATLPVLKISDADQEPIWTETTVFTEDQVNILYHKIPCHGIVYLNLYFNLSDVALEDLTRLGMVDAFLGQMPTANHDVLSLEQDIKKYTGRMDFSVSSRCKAGRADACTVQLCVHMSTLSENLPQALSLLLEILTTTRFEAKDKVNEIVMQCEMSARQRSVTAGHRIAMTDALSHFSSDYAAKEALDGATYIRWLHAFAADFDSEYPAFADLLARNFREDGKRNTVRVTGKM